MFTNKYIKKLLKFLYRIMFLMLLLLDSSEVLQIKNGNFIRYIVFSYVFCNLCYLFAKKIISNLKILKQIKG